MVSLTFVILCCVIYQTSAETVEQTRDRMYGDKYVFSHPKWTVKLLTTQVNQLELEMKIAQLQSKYVQLETHCELFSSKIDKKAVHKTSLSLSSQQNGGAVYVRWGRIACPANGTDLAYTGYVAGNKFDHNGAAAFLCLTSKPILGAYDDAAQTWSAKVYGTEYEFGGQSYVYGGAILFGKNLYNYDARCAVCYSSRRATVMIPGRNQCYAGWTKEYSGYLVAGLSGHSVHKSPTNYACLDADAEYDTADHVNYNGYVMYLNEDMVLCRCRPCKVYVKYRELTCVVCSK